MKKIAVLNDLSGMGKCSLTAAIPVISVMGVQACPLPTAILSNQTAYPSYFCDDYTDRMDRIMEEWKKLDFQPDGIYTGFLAGEHQADKILDFIECFSKENTWILVDPVLGDRGEVYDIYNETLCEKMRALVRKAQIITPNLTEAMLLLYSREEMEEKWQVFAGMSEQDYLPAIEMIADELMERFCLKKLVITGVDHQTGDHPVRIGNLLVEDGEKIWVFSDKYGGSYSGTGDLFASVLSAGLVKGIPLDVCVRKAVRFLAKAISDTVQEGTDRNDGVCFETYLYELMEDA